MSFQGNLPYGSFATQIIGICARIRDSVVRTPTQRNVNDMLRRLRSLRSTIASWPIDAVELRHQQALLVLIEDTVLWTEAHRDGGDIDATERDMSEAVMGVHAEVLRLIRARRNLGAAPAGDDD